ncbi:MAG: hypothetical protein FJZ62_04280 [Chlamydiae bacterium]|nr:hypothetical protein [Chlamydiota bacterium]
MISPVPSHQFNSIGLTPIHQNVDKEIEHNQHITRIVLLLLKDFYSKLTQEEAECLRNGVLDIGPDLDNRLSEGNLTFNVMAFSASMFFKTITEKIRKLEIPSIEGMTEQEKASIYLLFKTDRVFKKIVQIAFSKPDLLLNSLTPLNKKDIDKLCSPMPKNPQYSGSCAVKNLNSLLSNDLGPNSVSFIGGWNTHGVYAEIVKGEDGHFFGLIHNLGAGCLGAKYRHTVSDEGKLFPLPIHFKDRTSLDTFTKDFKSKSREDYEELVASAILKDPFQFQEKTVNRELAFKITNQNGFSLKSDQYKEHRLHQKDLSKILAKIKDSNDDNAVAAALINRAIKKTEHVQSVKKGAIKRS